MVKAEMSYEQIRKAIERLPVKQKVKLARELQQKTWQQDFKQLLREIRENFKRNPIPSKELNRIIDDARQEYHARSSR